MKILQLSLITILSLSTATAGGDIVAPETPAPVVAPVVAEDKSSTTVSGKMTGYFMTTDAGGVSMFKKATSNLAGATTLDVAHTFTEGVSANFSSLGYTNMGGLSGGFFDATQTDAYFNVANITANFADTTAIVGRQLLATPMLQSYDWLLAKGSFEAATLVNQSIEHLTLIGAYVTKYRANNTGSTFADIMGSKNNNFAVGGVYSDIFDASVWFYNIDVLGYKQVYADAGVTFDPIKVEAQVASTDYDVAVAGEDKSTAFGVQVSGEMEGVKLKLGYNGIMNRNTGFVDWNGLYTNSWNTTAANQRDGKDDINTFKVDVSTSLFGLSAEASYAYYDKNAADKTRYEANLILGYDVTETINTGLVFSNYLSAGTGDAELNQLELYANYKF